MRQLFLITMCVASLGTAQGAIVHFQGTVTDAGIFAPTGTTVNMQVEYTPEASGSGDPTATITSAVLTVGAHVWSAFDAGISGLTVADTGAGDDSVTISVAYNAPSSAGGAFGTAVLLIEPGENRGVFPDATEAAVNAIVLNRSPGVLNGFFFAGGAPAGNLQASGTATPEPGSLIGLSCLGLVFGGVAYRRRKRGQAAS